MIPGRRRTLSRAELNEIDTRSCTEVLRALQAYVDGEIDEPTARGVARHLEGCPPCGNEAKVYERLKTSLSRQEVAVDPDVVARLTRFGDRIAGSPDAGA